MESDPSVEPSFITRISRLLDEFCWADVRAWSRNLWVLYVGTTTVMLALEDMLLPKISICRAYVVGRSNHTLYALFYPAYAVAHALHNVYAVAHKQYGNVT